MSERRLEREDIHSSLYRVCGMAVPQLVWVNVEPNGSSPLPANISNCLAYDKSEEVITPWPGIVASFRKHKVTLDNRIATKTFEASYERYLNVALLHIQGRKAARTGKQLMEKVLTHQRVNQSLGSSRARHSSLGSRCRSHGWSAA